MTKKELIEIVNIVVEARIKKILPCILKDEVEKIKLDIKEEFKKDLLSELKMSDLKSKMHKEIDVSDKNDLNIPSMSNLFNPTQEMEEEKITDDIQDSMKTFSKNPVINRIMNDMIHKKGIPSEENSKLLLEDYKKSLQSEYEDMETFSFDTKNIASIVNRTAMIPQSKSVPIKKEIGQEVLKQQITAASGNPEIANAMIKDYRSLLKKADEGAQKYRTGK